jgi:competence protein ComGC
MKYVLKGNHFIKLAFIILISFILTSCIEVKHKININEDGSGDTKLEVTLSKEIFSLDPKAGSEIKNDLKKEGWKIVKEEEKAGKYIITVERKFKNISELNDDTVQYAFFSQKKGFLTNSYFLEIEFIKTPDFPISYELVIEMPGNIEETNGIKVSSSEVKWNLEGFSRGTKLFAKSSGFVIPTFVLLMVLSILIILFFIGIMITIKRTSKPAVSQQIIFCTQCGRPNPVDAFFCTNCGEKLK